MRKPKPECVVKAVTVTVPVTIYPTGKRFFAGVSIAAWSDNKRTGSQAVAEVIRSFKKQTEKEVGRSRW